MAEVERAEMADYAQAINPDGTRVDPFAAVAAAIHNVRYEDVTLEQRTRGKQAAYVHLYSFGGRESDG